MTLCTVRPFSADLTNDLAPGRKVRVTGALADRAFVLSSADPESLYTFRLQFVAHEAGSDDLGEYARLEHAQHDISGRLYHVFVEQDWEPPFLPDEEPYFNGTWIRVYVGGSFAEVANFEERARQALGIPEGAPLEGLLFPDDSKGLIDLQFEPDGRFRRGGYSVTVPG